MESNSLLRYAQRLQAIAQAGISYAVTPYDLERYEEIREISVKLLEELSGEPYEKIVRLFASETSYPTPKVDVRAVLFRGGDQILLVKEKNDHQRWALPGGWADIGYTPFEVAVKEVQEETGLSVRAVRLLALYDKRRHPHPPQAWYVYKVFIQCEIDGGQMLQDTVETAGARWFRSEELSTLELSTDRVTESQLRTLFRFAKDPELPALCD
ncbi:MAG TPA: NUDIX hydrolase [Acidobacteriaceae bacterium]|nr:NUDIX hydrolase [Acidobacteriaceae bacterium]